MITSPDIYLNEDRLFIVDFLSENCEFENKFIQHRILNLNESLFDIADGVGTGISVVLMLKERKKSKELKEVESSKGDIDNFKFYDLAKMDSKLKVDISKSTILSSTKKQSLFKELDAASKIRKILSELKQFFKKSFEKGFSLAKKVYIYMVHEIIMKHALIVCNLFKKDGKEEVERPECAKLAVDKFFSAYEMGVFSKLEGLMDKKSLGTLKEDVKDFGIKAGGAVVIGFAIYKGIFLLIDLVRLLVYLFYYMREKFSTFLRINAEYLEINSRTVVDEKVRERQKQWAEKLEKYANKISAEQQNADYQAKKEIKKEKIKVGNDGKVEQPKEQSQEVELVF